MPTTYRCALRLSLFAVLFAASHPLVAQRNQPSTSYEASVLADRPIAFWRFEGDKRTAVENSVDDTLLGHAVGAVALGKAGARPPRYLTVSKGNKALEILGSGYIKVKDPGENSPLDFDVGDTITLEAWVNLYTLGEGNNVYVVGKGRTNNGGFARENQNYALRLRGIDGTARVSFLFRNGKSTDADYHRWNSNQGFAPGSGWHHIAVSYTFGQPESAQGYVDGKPVAGTWDMAGKTKDGPVVDNDDLWIGSALGGSPGNTFNGQIDEVAIYRHAVAADHLDDRYRIDAEQPAVPEAELPRPPEGKVLVQVFEGVAEGNLTATGEPALEFTTNALALIDLPRKYNAKGLIADWKQPLLVRAVTSISPSAGEHRLMLRAKDTARVRVNDRVITQTGSMSRNASGHEKVPKLAESDDPLLRPLSPGLQEQVAEHSFDGNQATLVVEAMVGAQKMRPELLELSVAMASEKDTTFRIASPAASMPMTDGNWQTLVAEQVALLSSLNDGLRRAASQSEDAFWKKRHALAREIIARKPPLKLPAGDQAHPIDRLVAASLKEHDLRPAPLVDDDTFLRRVTLHTVGVIPTPEEIEQFYAADSDTRREQAIDRLLDDPRWADHWVSYWQDVLAENPNVLKGKLNNTGPFRWWIHEALLDNKPIDRFATELIMMEGSTWYGGPAGFALATQNDAPMAAKAHVIGKAFMAVEMKCARCHDAPFHDVSQRDTFNIAAMLARSGRKIPKTSVVPVVEGARKPEVEISLAPGDVIKPRWPFGELAQPDVPEELLRNADDERARLAAIITSPHNQRFAKVIVNRLWARLLGRGIVEPVDDWEDVSPANEELLAWLARELAVNDYDMKHVARLILTSQTYQRQVTAGASREARKYFATPQRRRMTAEQIVDSAFLAAGKSFGAEVLSMDPEGRRPVDSFLNLGLPTRAWQFTSLSNERDRPALAFPVAQSLIDILVGFGWREARQDPISRRSQEPTLLQPAVLANGLVGRRITTLSDDSAITSLAMNAKSPEQFVDSVFRRFLSRPAASAERDLFSELLRAGFEQRVLQVEEVAAPQRVRRNAVSWSNHLSPEATEIKLELERLARAGDPPTRRLEADWRERAEDMVWSVLNSPEFVFVP